MKIINLSDIENEMEVLGSLNISYLSCLIGLAAINGVCSETINEIHVKIQSIASTCSNLHVFAFVSAKDSEQKRMFDKLKKQLRREVEEIILFVEHIYTTEKEETINEKTH